MTIGQAPREPARVASHRYPDGPGAPMGGGRDAAMATHVFRIVSDGGTGGFLCPPGHPSHRYSIVEKSSDRWNAYVCGTYSLDSDCEWIPDGIRRRATQMLTEAKLVESPMWVANVYGYFRSMWSPDGRMWADTRELVLGKPDGEYPDEWHAGCVFVRKYFPDHAVRADLIRDPGKGYGSYPCAHCGERVQYEARHDALVIYPAGVYCKVRAEGHSY